MSEVYYEVHMTCVLHNSRISNVDSVMFINRMKEMVSFELGKEIDEGLTLKWQLLNYLRWLIYVINLVDNTKLSCFLDYPLFNSV